VILLQNTAERLAEITDERAADASAIHLGHFNSCVLHKAAVNADLAKFVLDQHQLLTGVDLLQQFFNQGCLSGTQKTRKNINLGHVFNPLRYF